MQGARLNPQARDYELTDGMWVQTLGVLSRESSGIGIREKSVQAHGLVLSMSPNYLDPCVLRFRIGGLWMSRYLLTLLGGQGHVSPPLLSVLLR